MRKSVKTSILEIIGTLYDAHDSVRSLIERNKYDLALSLLGDCQNTAVKIGGAIENSEGEGFCTVHLLEEYCEVLYQVSTGFNGDLTGVKAKKMLDKSLLKAEKSVKNDIKIRREIVFMPYKASMWDSLEGAWKEESENSECDVYVVPMPYYDRNPDHSFGKYHYEGREFPKDVPVVYYEEYNLEARNPDKIYIHNPYDATNHATSVDPRFYSNELKKHTDCLIYIPYFVLNDAASTEGFSTAPACIYADKIIVQSEKIRQDYIKRYSEAYGSKYGDPEKKFVVGKSFKIEKARTDSKDQYDLPEKWKALIGDRKVILYNTSLSTMLQDSEQYLKKLRWVLDYFKKHTDVALWWRPHPLMRATINSMRQWLLVEYDKIVLEYISADYGIFDDTADLHRAIAYSDAYYGDWSSVVEMYKATGRPIMIQSIFVLDDDAG